MKLEEMQCTPCAGGVPPMPPKDARNKLNELPEWHLTDNARRIEREFKFHDFAAVRSFVDRIAGLAEQQGHHPVVCFGWAYARVSFQTHDINGLAENDFIMAAKVNRIAEEPAYAMEVR
jgi:4a-hydroxytetrahydrobiopterin dehydratase